MIHIGTSGWHYKHWKGIFYPPGMQQKDFMNHYLCFFRTVEINNSFYKLPSAETFAAWRDAVPDDFIFSVKASRFITHMKKLKDPQESFGNFMRNVNHLGEKLGPILFQLPPMWKCDIDRLEYFLQALPTGYLYTFEFRNHTWYTDRVYELLEKHGAAFCIYDLEQHQSPVLVTANFVYVRLHGPVGKYNGSYSDDALHAWAEACLNWEKAGKEVYIYFDNDIGGHAVFDAQRLLKMVKSYNTEFVFGSG